MTHLNLKPDEVRTILREGGVEIVRKSRPRSILTAGVIARVREAFWAEHDNDGGEYVSRDCGPNLEWPSSLGLQFVATPECLDFPDTGQKVDKTEKIEPGDWWLAPPPHYDGESDYLEDPNAVWEFLPWSNYTLFPSASMPLWASRMNVHVTWMIHIDDEWRLRLERSF